MDALNSTASRQLTAAQSMKNLEKAVVIADQRIQMRKVMNARASTILSLGVLFPLSTYMIYHLFAPKGVM